MKKFICFFLAFLTVLSTFAFEPEPVAPSGTGTKQDPFLIENINNLIWINDDRDKQYKWFKQIADIDASETTNWYDGAGWKPQNIVGYYDGGGHTIYNLYINRPDEDNIGLFGSYFSYRLENLNIIDCDIHGKSNVGSLCGVCDGTYIINCYAVGKVIGENNVGGLFGKDAIGNGHDVYCNYFRGVVYGAENVGGIGGNVRYCSNCMSDVIIEGRESVGGISGYSDCSVSNCLSRGTITGKEFVGGIIGTQEIREDYQSKWALKYLVNSFSEIMVNGENRSGAVLGTHAMFWFRAQTPHLYTNYVSCVIRSYYDIASPTTNRCGIALTADQLSQKIYYDLDFDKEWDFNEDFQRPRLKCMKYVKASAEKGTVSVYPEKDVYFTNDFVELSATAWPGHEFKYFKINENIITNNNCSYPVTENLSIEAFFEPNESYNVDFDITGEGRVEVSPDKESYYWGDTVTISAYPESGYKFSNYKIDDTVITNAVFEYIVEGNQTISATFVPIDYKITKEVVGSGSIKLNPQKDVYNYGEVVNVTATNDTGYHFQFLVIDGTTNYTTTAQLTVSGNHYVKAVFAADLFYISVAKSYGGNVSVSPELDVYPYNTYVTVTATPISGYEFRGFSGTYTSSESSISFRVSEDVNLKATFGTSQYKVTLKDSNYGKITINPYKDSYDYNDQVTLTAIPNTGYKFKSLTCNGKVFTENNVSLAIVEDTVVKAEFELDEYTVVINDSTGGSLSISPVKGKYKYNEEITLTATPAAGYELKRVYNDVYSSTNLVSKFKVKGQTSFTAEFIQREYRCVVVPSDGGSVSVSPSQATYHYGDVVTITATPDTGYAFKEYSGSVKEKNKVCVVTIQDHMNIRAEFELASYPVKVNESAGGSLSISPVKDKYKYNEEITLTATPYDGYELRRVYNDTYSSTNLVSKYTVKGDTWFTPDFVKREYRCVVNTSEGGTVSVTPAQTTYHYGDVITFTAVPETDYAFKEYSGSVTSKDKVCMVTVKDHLNVNAEFYFDAYKLDAKATAGGTVSVDPEKEKYHLDEVVTVAATVEAGYSFAGFTGTVESKDNPLSLVMNQHYDLTAVFTNVEYKVTANDSTGGKLYLDPVKDYYHYNDEVAFTVETEPGWHLEEITGYYEAITNLTGTVVVRSDLSLTPVFVLNEYSVTLNVTFGGTINLTPAKETYHYNDVVTMVSKPDPSYVLDKVVINGEESEELSFTVTDDTVVDVTFVYGAKEPGGSGSEEDPFQIGSIANLVWLARNTGSTSGSYSVLTEDIDISLCKDWLDGKGFEPIGTSEAPYQGTFDGGGFSITGLTINDPDLVNAGLFGVAKNSVFKNISIVGAEVNCAENAGVLLGSGENCTVENVSVNGSVDAYVNSGVLVGSAAYTTVQMTSAEGYASGQENVGGIIGKGEDCDVANSFSIVSVTGDKNVGGIIGDAAFSTVSYVYAAGSTASDGSQGGILGTARESTVTSSFFDKTHSRVNGYGKAVSAQELVSRETFGDWDFINVWQMIEGVTRPFFRTVDEGGSTWEKLAGTSTSKIALSGVLSSDDLAAVKATETVCIYALLNNTLLADPVALSGTSFKSKQAKVQYNAKKRSLKFTTTVPQLTVGTINIGGVAPCYLTKFKGKLDSLSTFNEDISNVIGNHKISLCDDFMNNNCLTGTQIKLTNKGNAFSYKGTVNDVTMQVNVALKTGKISVKYTGKNKISTVIDK